MPKWTWLQVWQRALVVKHSSGQPPPSQQQADGAGGMAAAGAAEEAAAARGLHLPHHLGAIAKPLQRARPMDTFRTRHADERDTVAWQEEDEQGDVLTCGPALERLCSLTSSRDVHVRFINATPHDVRLLWLNYRGDEVAYDALAPGAMLLQHTFATHPWLVREAETATQLLLDGRPAFVAPAPTPAQEDAAAALAASAAAAEAAPAAAPAHALALAHAAAPAGALAHAATLQDSAPEPLLAQQPPALVPPPQQQQPALSPQQRRQLALARNAADALGISLEDALLIPTVTITMLPQLAWSVQSHRFFPAPLKASVRALLLSYQRLQRQRQLQQAAALRLRACADSSSSASSHAHLGDIPFELLPVIAGMAAPFAPQGVHLAGPGSADILPTLLPPDWCALAWGPLPMQGSDGGGE